jgi:pSer/pThr/pTyr-binding forkhead associated (FHA) protein
MTVSLVLVRADGKQSEIPLRKQVQVIGRQTDCQIRIPSSGVSRHHCELTVRDDGVSLRDLGSSNGTYVNRRRITQAELNAGDLIAIGDMVFVVRVDGQPATVDSEDVIDEGGVSTGPTPAASSDSKTSVTPSRPTPAKKPSLLDDDDSSDDSSVADFDFLDEDDDIKKQPKL